MLGGFERGMAELAGYRDRERIASDSVRGKSSDQLLEIAEGVVIEKSKELIAQGSNPNSFNIYGRTFAETLFDLERTGSFADLRIARGVVNLLKGNN